MPEPLRARRGRWPGWVYRRGSEPDPRFSLANERTLLAWIRTAAAFAVGGGGALLARELVGAWASAVSVGAFTVSLVIVCGALVRWARTERALRTDAGLPSPWLGAAVAGALITGTIVGMVVTVVMG